MLAKRVRTLIENPFPSAVPLVRSNPAQVERLNNFSWVGRAGDGSNAHTQSTEILNAHIREELQGLLAGFDSWVASGRTFPKTITRNGVKRSPRLYIPGLRWAHVAQDYIQKHTVWAHLAQACVLKHAVFQSTSKPRNIRANPRASPYPRATNANRQNQERPVT